MKKQLLLILIGAASAASLSAQCKISPAGMSRLQQWQISRMEATDLTQKRALEAQGTETHSAIVSLVDGTDMSFLSEMGLSPAAVVSPTIAIVNIPLDMMQAVADRPEVAAIEFGREQKPDMNYARQSGKVNQVQNGFSYQGKTEQYDGTGVITGLIDTGLDPNHANFRDEDGNLRVACVWNFNGSNGSYTVYNTPAKIAGFSSDTPSATHGTHVAGIMAGSYSGNGEWVSQSSPSQAGGFTAMTTDMPFKGVATGSTIAMAGTSTLSDANIITAVTKIVEYAENKNMPCVVNMSLGSNIGSHDGKDPYCQALSALGKRAIICMSAGNEGDENMSINRNLTATSNKITTFIKGNSAQSGRIDLWTNNNQAVKASWVIYDTSSKSYTPLLTVDKSTNGAMSYLGNSSSSYTQNATFNAAFSGYVSISANVATYNNRFNVYGIVNVTPKNTNATKRLGLVIEGTAGQQIWLYGSNCEFENLRSASGSVTGSPANSINVGATAENVISVGSYTTRIIYPVLQSGYYGYYPENYIMNEVSPFSSYGKTFQGVEKPDLCAPGCGIISSISTIYASAANLNKNNTSGYTNAYNRNNYWMNMQGTSMSSPFAAGVVGLWLQADNKLKYQDVMDVINATCTKDSYVENSDQPERWGAGKLNALDGIKKVLQNKAAIGGIAADSPEKMVFVEPVDNGYAITVAGAPRVNASLTAISGMEVARTAAQGDRAVIDTSSLQSGIYVLCVDTPAGRHTAKVTVK